MVPMRSHRPFWLPASNYYFLSVALALAFFIVVWGVLHDNGDDTPWLSAGISSGIVLVGAVILREWILRRARNNVISNNRFFDRQAADVHSRLKSERNSGKLTVEVNAFLITEIQRKSDAAKVLGKFAAVHREVFELCEAYLARNERELGTIGPGSPRLGAMLKGRDSVRRQHRFHMLQWAEVESQNLSREAANKEHAVEKIGATRNALGVIEHALKYYPDERSLIETRDLLDEMIVSVEVSHSIEAAERAAYEGDLKQARALYRDALFYLGRDNVANSGRDIIADRINVEIEKLRQLASSGQ